MANEAQGTCGVHKHKQASVHTHVCMVAGSFTACLDAGHAMLPCSVPATTGRHRAEPRRQRLFRIYALPTTPLQPSRRSTCACPAPARAACWRSAIPLPPSDYPRWDALPPEVVSEGKLSQLQLEGILYACTKHCEILPSGERESSPALPCPNRLTAPQPAPTSERCARRVRPGKPPPQQGRATHGLCVAWCLSACLPACRLLGAPAGAGFFIGDGAGVGKGRQISGVIIDNYVRGRRCVCPPHHAPHPPPPHTKPTWMLAPRPSCCLPACQGRCRCLRCCCYCCCCCCRCC